MAKKGRGVYMCLDDETLPVKNRNAPRMEVAKFKYRADFSSISSGCIHGRIAIIGRTAEVDSGLLP
jgi:hypothetical protein